jgi:pantothenate kinase
MPDPVRAHARRGAEFTFNGWAFLDLVKAIRAQDAMSPTVFAASFDHAVKDPKENDIPILASTRVVVFEGIYLALDKEPWRDAASLMDEIWYVDVDFDTAKRRLVERHVRSGIVANEVEAEARARENDLVNGEEIVRLRLKNIDEVIISREDNTWKHEA